MDARVLKIAEKILTRGGRRRGAPQFRASDDFQRFIDRLEGLVSNPETADLEFFLKFIFGKESFRAGQREVVARLLEGRDALALFPTGAGKSIAFQLAAMLMPGSCLVIEPTLSLIDDQISNLRDAGITRAVSITSAVSDYDELQRRLGDFENGKALFCYVTPERLSTPRFRTALRRLRHGCGISLVAIDEAHCVSEWGHDFRTAYLTAGRSIRLCLNENRPAAGRVALAARDTGPEDAPCASEKVAPAARAAPRPRIFRWRGRRSASGLDRAAPRPRIFRWRGRRSASGLDRAGRLLPLDENGIPGDARNDPSDRVPIVALTATASDVVLREVREALEMDPDAACLRAETASLRPRYRMIRCRSSEKLSALENILKIELASCWPQAPRPLLSPRGQESACGIIFCPHIEGAFGVQSTARFIHDRLGMAVDVYHGRAPEDVDADLWSAQRRAAAERFKTNRTTLLVATKAFGLGIDKPNIRFTVHLGIPNSPEALHQEAGRAGRDGKLSISWILASIEDRARARRLVEADLAPEAVAEELAAVPFRRHDDVTRMLQFHAQAFRGISREMEDIRQILHRLGNLSRSGARLLSLPTQHQPMVEKALYRLLCLGFISDYTVRYSKNFGESIGHARVAPAGDCERSLDMQYEIQVSGLKPEAISENLARYCRSLGFDADDRRPASAADFPAAAIETLLEAVYASVEKTRREAFRQMVLACLEHRPECLEWTPDRRHNQRERPPSPAISHASWASRFCKHLVNPYWIDGTHGNAANCADKLSTMATRVYRMLTRLFDRALQNKP